MGLWIIVFMLAIFSVLGAYNFNVGIVTDDSYFMDKSAIERFES
jgi:hypothetical protein